MKICTLLFWLGITLTSLPCRAQLSSLHPDSKADSFIKLIRVDKEDTNKVKHLIFLSRELSVQNADSAYIISCAAADLAKKINWSKGIAGSDIALAWCYNVKGNFSRSLELNFKALKMGEEIGDKEIILTALTHIGQNFYSDGDVEKAIEYHSKALEIAKSANDEWNMARNIGAIGIAYQNTKQYGSALQSYLNAYSLTEKIGNPNGSAIWLSNIGGLYVELKKYDSALIYLNRSAAVFKSLGNQWTYAGTLLDIGKVYFIQKNYSKSYGYLTDALQISIQVGALESQRDLYLALSNLYSISGVSLPEMNTKRLLNKEQMRNLSLVYYQKYVVFKDSIDNKEIQKKALSLEFEHKALSTKLAQKKKDAINNSELRTQKVIRNSFIAGSILLMLLIVVLINRNRLKRTIEIEKMRSRLSRDLHDDIGSTLSSINILSRTAQSNLKETNDDKIKASLEKINERSQRLLDSMSDIIWNINPGNDTIEEVMSRMREYATTVLEAKNIDYDFDFPKQKMDCKLTMEVKNNLYLIFKEAVNNLSKYSGCTKANLSLLFGEKSILLSIEDNGIGFDDQQVTHRGGLINMGQRAAEIKGTLTIRTSIKKGTLIELSIPRYC